MRNNKNMSNAPFSISEAEAVKFGWQTLKQNFWFFVLILIISGLVSRAPALFIREHSPTIAATLIGLIALLLQLLVNLGLNKIALMLHDGTKPTWKELFLQYPLLLKYLGASILYGLMVMVGLVLLIVPGVYLAIKYAFFGFVMVDKKTGIMNSLKTSAQLTDGIKWDLFGFGLLMGLLNLLGALALMIGLFVTIPVSLMASIYVYRKLESRLNQAVVTSAAPATPA